MVFALASAQGDSAVVASGSSLVSRPIPPSLSSNQYLDLDGNGTLDAIRLTFLSPLDRKYLDEELDSIVFQWIDSVGIPVAVSVSGTQLKLLPSDPKVAYFQFPQQNRFFPYLTSIDSLRFGKFGQATLFAKLSTGKATQLPLRLRDAMPPVIREASLAIGEDDGDPDRLSLEFSEPLQPLSSTDLRMILENRRISDGSIVRLEANRATLVTDHRLVLDFNPSLRGTLRPSSQDSVRLINGVVEGIPVFELCEAPLCVQQPFKLVVGDIDFSLSTSSFASIGASEREPMTLSFRAFGSPFRSDLGAGVFVDFGSPDLLQLVRRVLKQRFFADDSAVFAENIDVDSSHIQGDLVLSLYTNLGAFVAREHVVIRCTDAGFQQDCIQNPRQVFLRWNGKSQDGRMVGSGAYLAKVELMVRYDGLPGKAEIARRERKEFWGIVRQTGTLAP